MRTIDPGKYHAKCTQIMEAAIRCFAQKGFHATSTSEICAAAKMSPGTLFHYFPSKQSIIVAIAAEDLAEMEQRFDRLAQEEHAIVAIEHLVEEMLIAYSDETYARISLEVAAEAVKNSEIGALFSANEQKIKAALIALLTRGQAQGQVDTQLDAALAASWLIALADGAIGRVFMDPSFQHERHMATVTLMIRRFLTPHTPAPHE